MGEGREGGREGGREWRRRGREWGRGGREGGTSFILSEIQTVGSGLENWKV